MRGLIEKDLRLAFQRKQTIVIFVIMALLLGFSGTGLFVVSYLTVLAGIVASSTLNYDEFDNGLEFLLTLPIDRKTYIREKYLLIFASCIVGWAASMVVYVGCECARGTGTDIIGMLPILFILLPIMAVASTAILPLQLKFGAEKSRIVLFALIGCIAVVTVAIKNLVAFPGKDFVDGLQKIPAGAVMMAVIAICVLAGFISYFCSLRIMQRKEL